MYAINQLMQGLPIADFDDVGDGRVTCILGPVAAAKLKRQNGDPAESDDVLSVQRDGSLQARPSGSQGSFEVGIRSADGSTVTYWPDEVDGSLGHVAFIFSVVEL